MPTDYSYMDEFTDDEIADFKESGLEIQLSQIEITSGEMKFLSPKHNIVAEGDSWFDFLPGTDLLDCLRKHHKFFIKDYAKAGDTLENMIYGTGYNDNFQRTTPSIKKVLDKIRKDKPHVFLFSGGGNDIAGDEFASYLNHAESNLPHLRNDYANQIINTVFKKYFEDLIEKITKASPTTHIITHGYGHAIPTGKGVKFLGFTFSGPWIKPALTMKGISDFQEQKDIVKSMIDTYNEMLLTLDEENDKFHYVNFRDEIEPKHWRDELHLKNSAYAMCADLIATKINSL